VDKLFKGDVMRMIKLEDLLSIEVGQIPEVAAGLQPDEIAKLVDWLSLKDDKLRYRAFLLLKEKSRMDSHVYPYWDILQLKLQSENSYQRSLGVMLIAENVQWDTAGKMQNTLSEYLQVLQDPKPVTIRQCIQSLGLMVQRQSQYAKTIAEALLKYDMMSVRESMRKLILTDIYTLIKIQRLEKNERISSFITTALTGEILDKKSKQVIMKLM
jgi:hypothetical protein